jgi:hypothetical protein
MIHRIIPVWNGAFNYTIGTVVIFLTGNSKIICPCVARISRLRLPFQSRIGCIQIGLSKEGILMAQMMRKTNVG